MEVFRSYRFRALLVFLSVFFGRGFAVPLAAAASGKEIPVHSPLHAVTSHHSKTFKTGVNLGIINLDQEDIYDDAVTPLFIEFPSISLIAWEAACQEKHSDYVFPEDTLLSKHPVYLLNQNFRL